MRPIALVLLALPLLAGCPEPDPEPEPLRFPDLPTDAWTEFNPGGETVCSRGTDFAYWVRGGTENKIVVDFFGGGACWNQTTCSIADAIFTDSVEPIRESVDALSDGAVGTGIYNLEHEDNPFTDWYHVVIPYCTGDVHWGNNTQVYAPGPGSFTIEHKGAVNARSVLDWIYEEFNRPEQIVVTGCSAGSYGSVMWSAYLQEQYPDAQMLQFGDSGAGVITESFFNDSFPQWNAEEAFPGWIPSLDPESNDIFDKELADLYVGIGDQYPGAKMSQFNTIADDTQVFYFEQMGGGGGALWTERMLASIANIEARTDNFCSFTAPGDRHCIITRDALYDVESDGVLLIDWLDDLLLEEQPGSVMCEGCAD